MFGKTGLRVSQLALGTGWGYGADPEECAKIVNAYAGTGGNFIDTADIYQFGQSEELIGSLLEGRRENFVVATKFTNGAAPNADRLVTGNSRRPFVYLAAVVDWYSRRVLAWRLSITMTADFISLMLVNRIEISMDGKGARRDNVFVERLWRSVKYE